MVAAGGEVIAVVSGGEVSHAARMVAPGLLRGKTTPEAVETAKGD